GIGVGCVGGLGGVIKRFSCTLTLNTSTLSNNSTGNGGNGGNSSLAGNGGSGGNGGGIWSSNGTLTLNSSTLSNNSTGNGGSGGSGGSGGIDGIDGSGGSGGGILNSGNLTLNNSIIAKNTDRGTAPDIHQFAFYGTNSGVNFIGITSGAGTIPGTTLTGDPLLAPLGDYGGPTQTMPPLPGSPAIDAGSSTTETTDQRGFTREVNSTVDIGAVETGNAVTGLTDIPVDSLLDTVDGLGGSGTSLREAIAFASPNSPITFHSSLDGQTITLGDELLIDQNLTIDASALPNGLTIDANNNSRAFFINSGTVTLDTLTITGGNSTDGGGIFNLGGNLTLSRSTVFNNTVSNVGAGLFNGDGATATVKNCTFTGNSTTNVGGGIFSGTDSTLSLSHVTIVGNTAVNGGGGVLIVDSASEVFNCEYSVIALNATTNGTADVQGPFTVNTLNFLTTDPLLAPLGNYGGPTPTMPPLPGSPALDTAITSSLLLDQRGTIRPQGSAPDIGAIEVDPTNDFSPLISSPSIDATGVSISPTITWTPNPLATPGSYQIVLDGNIQGSVPGNITSFLLSGLVYNTTYTIRIDSIFGATSIPGPTQSFTTGSLVIVNTNVDESDGSAMNDTSLRDAITEANNGDTITFDPALSGLTILLTNGQLLIDTDLIIDASTLPSGITIDANQQSRVIEIASGSTVTLDSLALINGQSADGTLSVPAGEPGGGIFNDGTLILNSTTVSRNTAGNGTDVLAGFASGGSGGGIYSTGNLTLNHSTVSRNLAGNLGLNSLGGNGGGGGGIYCTGVITTLNNSTIAENITGLGTNGPNGSGGGVFSMSNTLTINNSTISGNTAVAGDEVAGGGIVIELGSLSLNNSVVAKNIAPFGNDIIQDSPSGSDSGINFIGDLGGSGRTVGSTVLTGDPLLAPLGDYGGPTQTMIPLPGSPVIDPAGGDSTSSLATDQRGNSRISNGTLDIGAVEYDSTLDEPIFAPVITSFTQATGFDPTTNPVFDLTFTTFPGLSYSVENNPDLQGNFTPLGQPIQANNTTLTLQVTLDPTKDFVRAIRQDNLPN
ncbi:MAG: choice-of-anchor Q domain-containing protein, partial [Verrucomicrobiota bacterium]